MNKSALVSSTNNACKKFTQFNPYLTSYDQAILYLKLRKDGCNRRSALLFSKKQMCRSDVTKEIDGPSCCRTLTPDNADHIFCQNVQFSRSLEERVPRSRAPLPPHPRTSTDPGGKRPLQRGIQLHANLYFYFFFFLSVTRAAHQHKISGTATDLDEGMGSDRAPPVHLKEAVPHPEVPREAAQRQLPESGGPRADRKKCHARMRKSHL